LRGSTRVFIHTRAGLDARLANKRQFDMDKLLR
jgi:hypothetical protein